MTERLFFALHPDADAVRRIAELRGPLMQRLGLTARPIPPERSHVTVLFVGTFPTRRPELERALLHAGASVQVPAFTLRLDRIASFNRRTRNRPIVLLGEGEGEGEGEGSRRAASAPAGPGSPAGVLHAALAAALRERGVAFDNPGSYTPHLTLMYDDRRVEPQPIEPVVAWTVRHVALMRSLVGRSTHEELGRWSLPA